MFMANDFSFSDDLQINNFNDLCHRYVNPDLARGIHFSSSTVREMISHLKLVMCQFEKPPDF
jgi:hypothetical protein